MAWHCVGKRVHLKYGFLWVRQLAQGPLNRKLRKIIICFLQWSLGFVEYDDLILKQSGKKYSIFTCWSCICLNYCYGYQGYNEKV